MNGKRIVSNILSIRAASISRETSYMNAVDTNVLVYFVDSDEPAKRAKAIDR